MTAVTIAIATVVEKVWRHFRGQALSRFCALLYERGLGLLYNTALRVFCQQSHA